MVTHDRAAAEAGGRLVRLRDGHIEGDAPTERAR
jgi:predicted ABC-type transport system involved in lysophospholipase L1 biosynthesis ATPase subunit